MVPHLPLREDVVSVLPIRVAYNFFLQGNWFAILKIPGLSGGKQAEECACARRARRIFGPLNINDRIKAVPESKVLLRTVGKGFKELRVRTDILVIASTAVALRYSGGPEPLADLGGLMLIRLARVVIEEHPEGSQYVSRWQVGLIVYGKADVQVVND